MITLILGSHSLLIRVLEQPFVCVTLMWASIVIRGSLSSEGTRGRLREVSASSYKTKAYSGGAPSKVTLHASPVTLRRSSQPRLPLSAAKARHDRYAACRWAKGPCDTRDNIVGPFSSTCWNLRGTGEHPWPTPKKSPWWHRTSVLETTRAGEGFKAFYGASTYHRSERCNAVSRRPAPSRHQRPEC